MSLEIDTDRWAVHFRHRQLSRPEPDWTAPMSLSPGIVNRLVRSLEQFQLSDGGGPASLIAWNAETFRSRDDDTRLLVDLWFEEEKEHTRLLSGLVRRFGGQRISGHWSFSVFCGVRRLFGVRFELTVLLLTEIASTVYYRLLYRHCADPVLREVCGQILRDEVGHVAFHRDRLARKVRGTKSRYGLCWAANFHILGHAAATMLWINHASALTAIGATRTEFYREVRRELFVFVRRLQRESHLAGTMKRPEFSVRLDKLARK